MPTLTRVAAALTALSLGGASLAQTPPPLPSLQKEAEARLVWGVLLRAVSPAAFEAFSEWVKKKIAARCAHDSPQCRTPEAALASVVSLAGYLTAGRGTVLAGVEPNARAGTPQDPLRIDGGGENYQGVNVAVVSVDAAGKPLDYRPLGDGFNPGERFKLQVLSTFDALVVLGNINPKGVSRQIYPGKAGHAVYIPAGKEVLLPLGAKEHFKFAGTPGQETLTFTVRDPRSLESGRAATAQAFRKDENFGSSFVQSVVPEQYPVIAESFPLKHRAVRD